jgi:hypothetical protein
MPFAVTQQMLDDAQAAYHALMLGESVVEYRDQNGERVVRTKADANKLLNYINWLKSELGVVTNPAGVGPMRVWM